MLFEVVMPVYNCKDYIQSAIASVRAQTWNNWKLSILDAGSTDGSAEIASDAAKADSRITSLVAADDGQYDALRSGFDRSRADVLSWLNADDLLSPWSMETAAVYFNHGERWITGQPGLWDRQGRQVGVKPLGQIPRWMISHGFLNDRFLGCLQQESTYFSASLWNGLDCQQRDRFAQFKLAGDFYLWYQFAQATQLRVVPSVLGGFRVHGSNRSAINAEAYVDEAHECGAVIPPSWIAKRLRSANDYLSALGAVLNFRRSAAKLHTSSLESTYE